MSFIEKDLFRLCCWVLEPLTKTRSPKDKEELELGLAVETLTNQKTTKTFDWLTGKRADLSWADFGRIGLQMCFSQVLAFTFLISSFFIWVVKIIYVMLFHFFWQNSWFYKCFSSLKFWLWRDSTAKLLLLEQKPFLKSLFDWNWQNKSLKSQ